MRLTRRNALVGLGTVAAGAGVVGGSGAFTSVEAERTVNVSTESDADAALSLKPADTENSGDYVTTSNDQIQLDLSGTQGDSADSSGLNRDAITKIASLITVTNNGSQELSGLKLHLETDSDNIDESAAFGFTTGNGSNEFDNDKDVTDGSGLSVGGSLTFGVIVDLIDSDSTTFDPNKLPSSVTYTLEIIANT
jgi:hypothetical protein